MERDPRAAAASRVKACLLAAGLTLLAAAHANPFASPEPPPPPTPEVPLPPALIDQLPPLPTPSLDAPLPEPQPTPEELLAELLPSLTPPTLTLAPSPPSVPLPHVAPAYRPELPTPAVLEDAHAHAAALAADPGYELRRDLDRYGVQLLAVILSGTPRAVIQIDAHPYVIPYGDTLPGGNVRVTAVTPQGVVLTYQGASLELPLGGDQ